MTRKKPKPPIRIARKRRDRNAPAPTDGRIKYGFGALKSGESHLIRGSTLHKVRNAAKWYMREHPEYKLTAEARNTREHHEKGIRVWRS